MILLKQSYEHMTQTGGKRPVRFVSEFFPKAAVASSAALPALAVWLRRLLLRFGDQGVVQRIGALRRRTRADTFDEGHEGVALGNRAEAGAQTEVRADIQIRCG